MQHGASTLPDDLFDRFPRAECAEIHLATGFQNMLFDGGFLPDDLKAEMYAWLDANCADEKKADMTDEQFYYKTRKKAYGPFKQQLFDLPADARHALRARRSRRSSASSSRSWACATRSRWSTSTCTRCWSTAPCPRR